jgi:hypothetical protein
MTIQGSIPIRAKENLKGMVEESRPIQPIPAVNARKIPEPPSRRIPETAAEAIKVWLTTHNESSQAAGEDSEFYGSEESFVTVVVEIATSFFSPRNDTTNQGRSEKLYNKITTWMDLQEEEYEDHNIAPIPSQEIEWEQELPELSPNDTLLSRRLARRNRRDESLDAFGHAGRDKGRHIFGLEKLQGDYDRNRMGENW